LNRDDLPYGLLLQLACYSNETDWLTDEYDIPAACYGKVAELLGYDSPAELIYCYPLSADQVMLISQQCHIQVDEDKVQGDYSWFIDCYSASGTRDARREGE
jgi:hypothetical protein